jgi:twitching motility protein PilT
VEIALNYAIKNNCSDIHITENQIVVVREKGIITRPLPDIISQENINSFIEKYVPIIKYEYEKMLAFKSVKECSEINAAFDFAKRRFRVNIYRSLKGITLAIRLLNDNIPRLDELYLPESIYKFATTGKGLFLVCGATGSGKTTTNTAILNYINQTKAVNIITNEDPIEYIIPSAMANVIQREVGIHSLSFDACTENALRQDPDVIVIGELRKTETIKNTLTLAQTGHLVFGTVHTNSAVESVDRLVGDFEPSEKEQIRNQIANVLQGVIHQTLIRNNQGKRVPLVEILICDDTIRGMIRAKQTPNAIKDYMRGRKEVGSVHIVDNAVWHIQNSRFDIDDIKYTLSVEDFNLVNSILANSSKRGVLY